MPHETSPMRVPLPSCKKKIRHYWGWRTVTQLSSNSSFLYTSSVDKKNAFQILIRIRIFPSFLFLKMLYIHSTNIRNLVRSSESLLFFNLACMQGLEIRRVCAPLCNGHTRYLQQPKVFYFSFFFKHKGDDIISSSLIIDYDEDNSYYGLPWTLKSAFRNFPSIKIKRSQIVLHIYLQYYYCR